MNNYVRFNNPLNNEMVTLLVAIFFIVIIFALGFCLGRYMRIKKLENKWDKELVKTQKIINEILGKSGISKEVILTRGGEEQ
ncbi:unnamed protein product [marine sediment metagenome]|uniref:Uncharacterized protein n=1 Tax=marine sediment metagenome TaxID=412755 RepID=X1HU91_9ZZZZ